MLIDTSTIENYENLSAEEKVAVLESYDVKGTNEDISISKMKKAMDKALSETANYKKLLREKQSEQEIADAERKEAEERMKLELEELKKEKAISTYVSSYMSLGYSEELARSSASAMLDNDMAKVFENQKIFNENLKKQMETERLSKQPTLTQGNPPSSIADEDRKKLNELRKSMGLPIL